MSIFAFVLVTVISSLAVYTYTRPSTRAYAATSSTLNFQARLANINGSSVNDGLYNIRFKLYDTATNGTGTQLWSEQYIQANRVRVVNGYFSVNLGSQTAFGAINWDQDLWITMDVGGTTNTPTPTYDGEMLNGTQRTKLTAVPYAFRAGSLAQYTDASNSSYLNFATPSGNNTITIPTLTGTIALLQNAQTFSGAITFGAAGTGLTVSNNATITGDLAVNGGDITANATTTIAVSGAGNDLIFTSADQYRFTGLNCTTFANGGALTTDASGNISCSDDNGGAGGATATLQQTYDFDTDGGDAIITLTSTDGAILIRDTASGLGTNLFAVQSNGGGTNYFAVSATGVSTSGTLQVTGASTLTGGATVRGLTVDSATATQDRIITSIAAVGAARFDGTITNADLTAARTYTLPDASGTLAVSASGNIALSATGNITLTGQVPIANGGTGASTAQAAINALAGLTTTGDLLYYDGANSTRLARGTNGQCLTSNATTLAWASCVSAEADTLATVTGRGATTSTASSFTGGATIRGLTVDTATATQDRIQVTAAATGAARFDGTVTNADLTAARTYTLPDASGTFAVSASGNIALSATGNITVTGQIPISNGGTGASTAQGAIDALSGLTTNGDLLYHNGTNSTRLARGTNGQCLTSNATTLVWSSCGGSGVTTVGAFSASSQTNGANITGVTITFGPADTTNPGMVSTGAQTFGGNKTVQGTVTTQTATATDDKITLSVTAGGAATFTGTLTNADLTAARTYTLPDASGTFAVSASGNIALSAAGNISLTGQVPIANGGTGASTSQAAINALSQLNTTGDLLYYDGANSTRLARGTNGQCLTSNATTLAWASCVSAEADTLASVTGRGATTSTASSFTGGATIRGLTVDTATATQDRILVTAAATGAARFDGTITNADLTAARTYTLPDASGTFAVSASGNIALSAAGNITVTGQIPISNGGTGASTSQGAIDAISQLTTNGDIMYHNGTNSTRLARGTNGQCLTSNATTIVWGSCGGGVTTVGAFSASSQTNGANITGSTITFGPADTTNPGMVSTTAQTFGGNKTFQGTITTQNTTATDDQIILSITTGGAGRFNGTITNADLTAARSYTLPDASGTLAVSASGNIALSANGNITLTGQVPIANGGTGASTSQGAIDAISQLTTNGDLLYHNGTNSTRLARGTNGQCLTSNATTLVWSSCVSAEADTLATVTGRGATTSTASSFTGGATIRGLTVDTATATQDRILVTAAATGAARFDGTITNADLTAARTYTLPDASGTFAISASGNIALSAAGNISLTGQVPIANGGTGASTAQGAIDAISGLSTNGDLLYHNGTNSTRLARGTNGQCLTSNATTLVWASCVGAEADTLASVTGRGATTTVASTFTGGATIRGITIDTATATDDQILVSVTAGGAGRFNGTITNADLTAARTYTLPDASGTLAVSASGNIALSSTGNITLTGQVPIANGGTGASTSQAAINALSQLTTTGDLLYYDGANSTRLARGTNGQCLTSNATTLVWASCVSAEADTLASVTGRGATTSTASTFTGGATIRSLTVDTATATQDRILVTAAATGAARFDGTITNADLTAARTYTLPDASGTFAVSASGNIALSAAGNITVTGQIPIANGGTGASTSQGAIDAISQLTTNGDILYHNGTNSTRLARGTNGQCLTSNATTLVWGSCGSGVTTVGAFSASSQTNGANITGSTITFGPADTTNPGMVSTAAQTFGGNKTFQGTITTQNTTATDDQIILSITTGGAGRFNGTITNADLTAARTYTLPDASGTLAVSASGNIALSAAGNITLTGQVPIANGGTGASTSQGAIDAISQLTTNGDLLYHNGTNSTRLARGTNGQCLTSNATTLVWSSCVSAEADTLASVTGRGATTSTASSFTGGATIRGLTVDTATATQDRILVTAAATGAARFDGTITNADLTAARTYTLPDASGTLAVSASGNIALSAAGNITLTGQVPIANGGTGANSSQGAINALSQLTTTGDLLYYDGANSTRLGRGTNGQCLTSNATTIVWGSCSGATTVTAAGGTTNRIAKFSAAQAIVDSTITDDGTNVSLTGDLTIQGGSVIAGTTSQIGDIVLHDGNGQTTTLRSGNPTSSFTLTLPSADSTGVQCLKSDGAGTLSFANCNNGTGAGGTTTLQDAYDAGNTITTTNARNIAFNLADTATDSSFIIDMLGTGNIFEIRDAGTAALTVADGGAVTANNTLQVNGTFTANGNVALGNAAADTITITGTILGATPLVFEGATSNTFQTSFLITDPTADRSITVPNADGTLCLTSGNCAGLGGNGDILQNGNSFTATMTIGTNDAQSLVLETQGSARLTIDSVGAATFSGTLTTNGLLTANTDVDLTLVDTENLNINNTVGGTNAVNVEYLSVTNSSASGNQRGLVVQNLSSTGITESLLSLDNIDPDTAVTDAISITNSGGGFTNILNTPSLDITGAGAITGATGVTSSGTITFSGLSTAGIVTNTAAGVLGTVTLVPIANGGTNANSSQGAINNISQLTTTGDLLYYDGANSTRLARGTNGQCLTSNATTLVWASCVSAEADTLASVTGRGATTSTASSFTGGATIRGLIVDTATATQDRILVTAAATGAARFDGTITNADLTAARTYTLPDASGTLAVSASGNIALSAAGNITLTGQVPIANGGTGASTSQGAIDAISQLTTEGDLLFRNATNSTRLPRGTNGQCLLSNATTIAWGSCNGSGVTTVGAFSASSQTNGANITGTTITFGPADTTNPGMVSTAAQTLLGLKTFNSGLQAGTATATDDKITLSITAGGAASFVGTMTNADLTAARTWTFQDNSGVVALGTAANSLFFTTTGATNVTLPTSGTLCSTSTCVTAEADTLATVTGRGATTSTASSFTGGATIRGLTVDTATATQDRILVTAAAAGAARFDGTITNADLTAARSYTLPDASGTFAISASGNIALSAAGNITLTGQVPIANGGTGASTSQGAIDAISQLTTEGDILFRNATNSTRLARGTNGQCLTSNATTIVWASCGSGVTTVGAFSASSQTNGANITGSTITFGPADTTNPGMVSTGAQTFGGNKTFQGTITTQTATATQDQIILSAAAVGAARFAGTITNADLTAARSFTLPDASGTFAVSASGNIALSAAGNITLTGQVPIANGGTGASTAQGAIDAISGLTTNGDLLYHNGTNSTRLARGTNGQCLTSNATTIVWGTCVSAEADTLATVTGRGATTSTASSFTGGATIRGLTVDTATATQDRILITAAATGAARFDGSITNADLTAARTYTLPDASGTFAIGASGNIALSATGTITLTGQVPIANGGTGASTAQGAIDAISGLTTNGDIMYHNGTNSTRLARGTTGQCLTSNATTIVWGSCSSTGVTTVGTFSASSQTNGATIAGNTITFGPADATNPGMVSTGTQTWAGAKTFNSSVTAPSFLTTANGGTFDTNGTQIRLFSNTAGVSMWLHAAAGITLNDATGVQGLLSANAGLNVTGAPINILGGAGQGQLYINSDNTLRSSSIVFNTKNSANPGGAQWNIWTDADGQVIGNRQWSLWGYPKKTTDGSTYGFERFFTASFPTANDTTYTKLLQLDATTYVNANLGVGTSSPLAQLSIGSGSLTDANVPLQMSTGGAGTISYIGVNKNGGYGLLLGYENGGGNGTGAMIRNATTDPMYFLVNSTTKAMTILSGGNVGIGVTSPASLLTVGGAARVTTGGRFVMESATNLWNFDNSSGTLRVFRENTDGSAGSVKLSVTDAGDVGIGTSGASTKLDVIEAGSITLATSSTYTSLFSQGGATLAIGGSASGSYIQSFNALPLFINNQGNNTIISPTTSGNVGIGTASPGAKLEIDNAALWTNVSWAKNIKLSGSATSIEFRGGQTGGAGDLFYGFGATGTGFYMWNMTGDGTGVAPNYTFHSDSGTLQSDMTTGTGTVVCAQATGSNPAYTIKFSATSACTNPSARRLKDNITNMGNGALGILGQLRPVSFNWKQSSGVMAMNGGSFDYGLIADEVDSVIPELVARDENTGEITGLNYAGFAPFLIKGIQEQQQQIVNLQNTTADMELQLSSGTFDHLTIAHDVSVGGNLTVVGSISTMNITVNGHIITAGNAPQISLLAAAGTNAAATVEGNDTSGTITLTTGSPAQGQIAAPTAGDLIELTFSSAFSKTPRIMITGDDGSSVTLAVYPGLKDATKFRISTANLPNPQTNYHFTYYIVE